MSDEQIREVTAPQSPVVKASESLFRDPRRFRECPTCLDFGMLEGDGYEDVCPTCEGGVWREREPWPVFFRRARLPLGLRFKVWRWPFFYRDFRV